MTTPILKIDGTKIACPECGCEEFEYKGLSVNGSTYACFLCRNKMFMPTEAISVKSRFTEETQRCEAPNLQSTIGSQFLDRLSLEVGEWAKRNFDSDSPTDPAVGLLEEVGELFKFERMGVAVQCIGRLAHHALKARQGIRGEKQPECTVDDCHADNPCSRCIEITHANQFLDQEDFLQNELNNSLTWHQRHKLITRDSQTENGAPVEIWNKKKNRPFTEEEIKEEKADAIADIIVFAADYCYRNKISFGQIVAETWSRVSKRDWRKSSANAADVIENNEV